MTLAKVIISAGHGKHVAGAVGVLDEHKEAVRLGKKVVDILGSQATFFQETTARTQRDNLNNIVRYHNSKSRVLDVSIHFNSAASSVAGGTECLYLNPKMKSLSAKMSAAMAKAMGISDRGPKYRSELAFLRGTTKPAILLEVCFVSSKTDAKKYHENFNKLAQAIAKVIANQVGISISTGGSQEKEKPSSTISTHTVKKSETLYGIAKQHGISVEKLKAYNNLTSNVIKVGAKLKLKKSSSQTHTVVKGDTLYSLANKYKTTVAAIKQANGLKSDVLTVGTKLKVK